MRKYRYGVQAVTAGAWIGHDAVLKPVFACVLRIVHDVSAFAPSSRQFRSAKSLCPVVVMSSPMAQAVVVGWMQWHEKLQTAARPVASLE